MHSEVPPLYYSFDWERRLADNYLNTVEGYWRDFGYGIMCLYKEDYLKSGQGSSDQIDTDQEFGKYIRRSLSKVEWLIWNRRIGVKKT